MSCGLLAKVALSATLLGTQQLKVVAHDVSNTEKHCETAAPSNANAIVILKDASGRQLHREEIFVTQFDFYLNGSQRGGVPSTKTAFIYSYPVNEKTSKAVSIELQLKGREFRQPASLPVARLGMK